MKDVKKLYAGRLKEISLNITPKDKADARKTISISRPTLDSYLSGDIKNLEKAEALVVFFTNKIQNRIDRLRETNLV
jgi:hypothetical protein